MNRYKFRAKEVMKYEGELEANDPRYARIKFTELNNPFKGELPHLIGTEIIEFEAIEVKDED